MKDKELFYKLCKSYNVEFSNEYKSAMIRDGNEIKRITEDEVKNILAPPQTYFNYESIGIIIKNDNEETLSFEVEEFLVAG